MAPFAVRRGVLAMVLTAAGTGAAVGQGVTMPSPLPLTPVKATRLASPPAAPGSLPAAAPEGGGGLMAPPVKDLTPPELTIGPGHGENCPPAGGHAFDPEEHEGGFFGTAEYLLLRPRRGATEFVTASGSTAPVAVGPVETLTYEQRSGVRANLGYRLPGEGWDVAAGYTFVRSGADKLVTAPAGGVLYPTLTRPGVVDTANTAAASASFEYNVFDAEVGKRFRTERGNFRVFAGARFATIRQDFDVNYDGRDAQQSRVVTRNGFDGFGPIVGGDVAVNVYRGFQLYARANGGLLTGRVNAPLTETNQNGLTTVTDIRYGVRKVVPTAHLGIGGGWQSGRVSIRAGYEITNWFGLLEAPRVTSEFSPGRVQSRSESLSLEGLFVQLGVAF
jgi:hypothetical protein